MRIWLLLSAILLVVACSTQPGSGNGASGVEPLDAGETLTYEASWLPASGTSGELDAVGELTSSNHPVEQRVRFRYP